MMERRKLSIITEAGRSMIEMLSVLVIIGVLSMGALTGYSAAMTSYNANQAIDEIRNIIALTQDLYADRNNFDGLDAAILISSGIMNESPAWYGHNYFEEITYPIGTGNYFNLFYQLQNKDEICQKILLAGWDSELGQQGLRNIRTRDMSAVDHSAEWGVELPMTMSGAATMCTNIDYITFGIFKQ